MYKAYRWLTILVAPLLPLWFSVRIARGKEERGRLKERYGIASIPRPDGPLLWLHAASVGEANSVLLLIEKIQAQFPAFRILLTTGTVTSARLMKSRLKNVIHQYAPVDTPDAVWAFLRHWKPQVALMIESELWPNLILAAREYHCFMGLINARMSARSFSGWKKYPEMITRILGCFHIVLAQSDDDAKRLKLLGAKNVGNVGNLKFDAAPLPYNEQELFAFKTTIGERPLWLAASTQPGEEALVAEAHALLSVRRPNLLCIIVPRHPERGIAIAAHLRKHYRVALRSKGEPISATTQFYIADTLGELGLFYRLSGITFMGGSLVRHGGQNPLEPARLSCAIVTGPHTQNFAAIYDEMERAGLILRAKNAAQLTAQIDTLLNQSATASDMQVFAAQWVEAQSGAAGRVLAQLEPVLKVSAA